MKQSKKVFILVVVSWIILVGNVLAQSSKVYGKPSATYKAPQGFTIISYSKNWGTPLKLKEISQELLRNTYAKEITSLKKIYIYPDSPDGVLGYTHYDLRRDAKGNYIYGDNTYIEIFDAEGYKDVQDMAWVLSHEYGHHFTAYHLVNKEKKFFDQWRTTGYAKARNIGAHSKISYGNSHEGNVHMWDIAEIAAEDYVQLFGSPNAKKSIQYKDIQQRINENISQQFNYEIGFNMRPQENLGIPLAADVKGLETYWQRLSGMVQTNSTSLPITPTLRLVSKKEVAQGHFQYRLEWNEIPGNTQYEYTLIGYPDEPRIFPAPIKTVYSGESMYAILGSALKTNLKTGVQNLMVDEYTGRYVFDLFIKDSNNKMYKGKPFKVNFNYPVILNNSIYKDMHQTDWAYGSIKALTNRKLMVGSPDNYFYPLKYVTYTDMIVLLDRCLVQTEQQPRGSFTSLILKNKQVTQKDLDKLTKQDILTREDVAFLAYQYIVLKNPNLEQINGNTHFKDDANIKKKTEINYLAKRGILKGNNNYYFPQNNISRQELASILVELLKY